jgi:nucleoside-diphosphate-sugar epimerase
MKRRQLQNKSHQEIWNRLQGKHLFLTGGTGFFGKSLLELVLKKNRTEDLNFKVTILTRDQLKFIKDHPELYDSKWIKFHAGDISTFEFPEGEFDYLMHFATPASASWNLTHPLEMFDLVVEGTRRVLDFSAQANISKILLASSGAVYGRQPSDCTHIPESYAGAPNTQVPASAYGEGKRVAELLGNIYSSKHHFEYKIARCFAFVGPYLDPNGSFAIGNFIRDALAGKDIEIRGDGSPLRSYLFSEDLIFWLFTILLDGKSGQAYNVGSDEDLTIMDIALAVLKALGLNNKVEVLGLAVPGKPTERYVPSISLARDELGLDVFTSLEDSIRKTAIGYQSQIAK